MGVEAATPAPTPTPTPASGTLTRPTDILTNNTNVWGIDRIDQVNLPLNDKIVERSTGSGVRVYVLDTGVREDHVEFLNEAGTRRRITELYCMSTDSNSCEDYNEHGTHVSGTALGLNVGVAPAAELYVVKTMSADGTGPLSIIIDAMAHVSRFARAHTTALASADDSRGIGALRRGRPGPPVRILDPCRHLGPFRDRRSTARTPPRRPACSTCRSPSPAPSRSSTT